MLKFASLRHHPTNTPRVFHVETTWKRTFPRSFNVEYKWSVCRAVSVVNKSNKHKFLITISTTLCNHAVEKETNKQPMDSDRGCVEYILIRIVEQQS